MRAADFARRRALIERSDRRNGYRGRAMRALVREARAQPVLAEGRTVAWRMLDGSVVCRKRRYRTQLAAQLDLARIARCDNHNKPVREYYCGFCNGFHLTHLSVGAS